MSQGHERETGTPIGYVPKPHEGNELYEGASSLDTDSQPGEYIERPSTTIAKRTALLARNRNIIAASRAQTHRPGSPSTKERELKVPNSPKPRNPVSDTMSKAVTFSGKPSQLEPCLTFARVTALANGTIDDSQKAGFLASLLRGPALHWLTNQLSKDPSFLNDYEEFEESLRSAFAIDDEAKRLQAARALAGLYQKGSVRDYSLKFNPLAEQAELNDQTKIALFTKGLKSKVREALIVGKDTATYAELETEAQRIDSQLYYSQRHQARNDGGRQRRGKDGKFVKQTSIKTEY